MKSQLKERLGRQDISLLIVGVAGLLVFAAFYGRLSPASAIRIEVDGKRASEIAQTFLEEQDLSLGGSKRKVTLVSDGVQIMYLQRALRPFEANRLMRERIPAYYWEVTWYKEGETRIVVGDEEPKILIGEDEVVIPGEIRAKVDGQGRLLAFDFSAAQKNTEETHSLAEKEALALAESFLSERMGIDLSEYDRKENAQVIHKGSSDWDFLWEKKTIGIADERIEIGVAVQRDRVVTYDFSYKVPEGAEILHTRESDTPAPFVVFIVLVWVAIGLTFIILFFIKAVRSELEYKLGLRLGIGLGAFIAFLALAALYQRNWGEALGQFLKAFFVFFGASLLWSVCDSLARSAWREKLAVVDALGRRRLLTVEYGLAALRGYALAFLSLGLVTVFTAVGVNMSLLWLSDGGVTSLLTSPLPFVRIVVSALILAVFVELLFRLFLVSLLRTRTHSPVIIVLVSGFCFGFSGFNFFNLAPTWSATLVMCTIAFVFTYAFLQYELTTVATGSFVLLGLWKAWPLLFTGDAFHFANGLVCVAIVGAPSILAYVSLRRGETVATMAEYVPLYMARALEQERIRQELEIARRVQRSFLPSRYPHMKGLDIAATCVPANEVGGDYYDFVPSGPNRLGIAIGDVSGKGVPAAFYMALTKGLLRAEAADHESPKEILSEVNARFYENSDPSVFISMVYGMLDLVRKRFTYARAGHNPVILRRTAEGAPQSFAPPGIALGLDSGEIFDEVIAEEAMDLSPGDLLVMYTDGFTEAINWRKEEFGEERLLDLIERNKEKSAEAIVSAVELELRAFIGDTSQRDDMTMVVVKICEQIP